jgi:AhpD family alkylhydroperoxidase
MLIGHERTSLGIVVSMERIQSSTFPLAAYLPGLETDSLETHGRTPAYLLAAANANPDSAKSLVKLVKTVLFGGTLPATLKLAMAVQTSKQLGSTYALAHFNRLANAAGTSPDPRTSAALAYARNLTADAHGIRDSQFAAARQQFNDAQLIELTMVVCFLNFFVRLVQGLGVQPEAWLASTKPALPPRVTNHLSTARVALASDDELSAGQAIIERWAPGAPGNSLGVGIPNSVRAMIHVPDIYQAWSGKPQPPRPNSVPRSTLLQVSLAVSKINGCRYCVLHQISGLRKQGVDVAKLVALEKSDAALSTDERAAVVFARKLTSTPASVTEADRVALAAHFPGALAYDVLYQVCRFAFMNRFTDTLRLPSEDEAVNVYKETFGKSYTSPDGYK